MHLIILILFVVGLFYLLSRGTSVFQLTVINGEITQSKGSISGKLLNDFESALSKSDNGKIMGKKSSQEIKLAFSGNIGDFTQQRIRNIFGVYRN